MVDRVKQGSDKTPGKGTPRSGTQGGGKSGDARRDRWRKHRIARRAEFVDAALEALEEHGPDLGMEHVAAAAGVTKPVLYRHFEDKADLYLALGDRGTEILFERLMPAINTELAPVPRIRMALDAFFTVLEEHLLARRRFADRPLDGDVTDVVAEDKALIANAVTALLGDYLRMFNVDSGAAEPWAHGVVGMVHNTGEWWLAKRTMSRDAVVEYLTQIIWAAIDGLARQHGIRIDPDRPVDANKIVQFNRSDDTDVPTTDDAGEAR